MSTVTLPESSYERMNQEIKSQGKLLQEVELDALFLEFVQPTLPTTRLALSLIEMFKLNLLYGCQSFKKAICVKELLILAKKIRAHGQQVELDEHTLLNEFDQNIKTSRDSYRSAIETAGEIYVLANTRLIFSSN